MKASDDATTYTPDNMFATYGHWLVVVDSTTGEATVNTYAFSGAPTSGLAFDVDPASTEASLRASTAEYSGSAAGRSVHKTLNSDGKVTDIQSGRFMADVMLTAKFGANPTLGGTVDKFRGVDNANAVDPAWTVKLMDTGIDVRRHVDRRQRRDDGHRSERRVVG